MGADNQQERLNTQWIAGFVDGEGCFHVAINKQPSMKLGWQVLPEFRVVQNKRDREVLEKIQEVLGCGKIRHNHGDIIEVRVRGMTELNKLIKFFRENELQTSKRKDFEIFAQIIAMMDEGRHLSDEGLKEIAELASKMNRRTKRAYLESSETIRRTRSRERDEIVRPTRRLVEAIRKIGSP